MTNRYARQGPGRVGENGGRNLISTAADSARAFEYRFTDNITHRQRHVTNHQASDDSECGIKNEADERAACAKQQASNQSCMSVLRRLRLNAVNAAFAGKNAINPVVASTKRLIASLATLRAGFAGVFGRPELWS